jgi:predicted nucleic acid-binding protein
VITDTQVLSYYFKGAMALPNELIRISSVTASEFLLIQSKEFSRANYYPILPSRFNHLGASLGVMGQASSIFDSKRHAAQGKHRTDQLILEFGNNAPTHIEFGSVAITQIINQRRPEIYSASISHLDKKHQKKLTAKFRFLMETGVSCVAITADVASIGMNLLGSFMDKYQPKENKRNTINDVLILATAISMEAELLTNDNLLARFAAEMMAAPVAPQNGGIRIDFSSPTTAGRRKPLESKGFINRGWQIRERRGRRQ